MGRLWSYMTCLVSFTANVVEKLSSSRKNLDDVQFVYAFEIVEKIPLVTLLKAYLEDENKVSQEIAQKGRDHVNAHVCLFLCVWWSCSLIGIKLSKY
jgi:hypothetical protein